MSFGSTPKDVSGIPISCVYVPNSGFIALQGSSLTNTDASSNQSVLLEVVSALYNGTGADMQRGNLDTITLLTSAAISANGNSSDQTNYNGKGVLLFINTGSFGSGESTMTVTIQGKDPVSGTYYTILQSASLSASTFTVLRVYPGLTASANATANDVLPRTWRVSYSASAWGTGGSTLGIAAAVMV